MRMSWVSIYNSLDSFIPFVKHFQYPVINIVINKDNSFPCLTH